MSKVARVERDLQAVIHGGDQAIEGVNMVAEVQRQQFLSGSHDIGRGYFHQIEAPKQIERIVLGTAVLHTFDNL